MIDEWKLDQQVNHTDGSPWVIFKNDYRDFDYYLEHLETKDTSQGFVPDSVFFLLDEERNRLVGAVNIRHYSTMVVILGMGLDLVKEEKATLLR